MINYDSRYFIGFQCRLYYCLECDQSYSTKEFCNESNAFKNRISEKRKSEWRRNQNAE